MSQPLDLEYTQEIKALLLSQTVDNMDLVLKKMAKGGVNKILLSYLTAIALKHPQRNLKTKARALLKQHAPPELQTYLQPYLSRMRLRPYYQSYFQYLHPSIYYCDAVLAEKMIFWHHQLGEMSAEPHVMRFYHQTWEPQYERISEIPFVSTIVVYKVQNFDFQHFMESIAPLTVHYLQFSLLGKCVTAIDMNVLCNTPHLQMLLFNGNGHKPILNIPKIMTAPMDLLSIRQCKINKIENLALHLPQLKHLLIE